MTKHWQIILKLLLKYHCQYMEIKIQIRTIYHCSLERAFRTPILCDVSKVHTGFAGLMPRVTHCTGDEHWGQPGHSKKIFTDKSLTQKGGWVFNDKVLERIENKYWKIEISDFQLPMYGLTRFTGEWECTELEAEKILITYTYTLHSTVALMYPLHWLFGHTLWRIYMKQVLENIRGLAMAKEPYLYA
jgi:hypothetical protein